MVGQCEHTTNFVPFDSSIETVSTYKSVGLIASVSVAAGATASVVSILASYQSMYRETKILTERCGYEP